jgi:hypothetical protein
MTSVGSTSTRDGDAEAALGHIQRAISGDHPWASPEHVSQVLRARYEQTHDAKVQNFRLVLAERATRAQLRHERASSHASPEGNDNR